MSADSLERAARRAADLFLELQEELRTGPVQPPADPAEVAAELEGSIGEEGVGSERAIEELARRIVPRATRMAHPMYFGLLNCSPLPTAALADLLVSTLNQNAGGSHQGIGAWAAEREVVRAFGELVDGAPSSPGAPPREGMLLPGGTFANCQALLVARAHAVPVWDRSGPAALPGPPRVYTSEASHLSVARSAVVAGIGAANVVSLPVCGRGELDPAALRERLRADRAAGALPVAVVATAGTTGTGAIDPLLAIAEIAAQERVWLHVDACYGGAALLASELRGRFAGIERADSVALDPHKWFFLPLTASLLLLREGGHDLAAFDHEASYVPADPAGPSAWRRGLPMSRRATALSVWTALHAHGWGTVRGAVRSNVRLARRLERRLEALGFDVLPGGELSIVCARAPGFDPDRGASPERHDRLQVETAAAVRASGEAWLATVRHGGRTWLVARLTNLNTREEHVDRLAALLDETSRRLRTEGAVTVVEVLRSPRPDVRLPR